MKFHLVEQGSQEWHELRAGKLTASDFATVCKRLKNGGFSQAAKDLAVKKALERIAGTSLDFYEFDTYAMQRGRELEEVARALYNISEGVEAQEVGIAIRGNLGASPDGVVGEKGLEIKCFYDAEKVYSILVDGDIGDVMYQVQGSMLVTGFKEWDFVLYVPSLEKAGLDYTKLSFKRDEVFIAEMQRNFNEFEELVLQTVEKITKNQRENSKSQKF